MPPEDDRPNTESDWESVRSIMDSIPPRPTMFNLSPVDYAALEQRIVAERQNQLYAQRVVRGYGTPVLSTFQLPEEKTEFWG